MKLVYTIIVTKCGELLMEVPMPASKIDYYYGLSPELFEEYELCRRVQEMDEKLNELMDTGKKTIDGMNERKLKQIRDETIALLGYDPMTEKHHTRPKSKPADLTPGEKLLTVLGEEYEVVALSAHPRVQNDDNLVTYKDGRGRYRTRSIASLFGHLPSGVPVVKKKIDA